MNMPLAFLNLGPQELMLILLIVLVLFGAKKIPELARGLGRGLSEFKRAKDDFDREIAKSADDLDRVKEDLSVKEPKDKQVHKA